ncbi:uncharacterized protein K489DRAFT_406028 [Dissoconium aciculare CBS 342.82]|uniref:Uncharacterized protein n=1 Tax=Dissoconium aciculare CBS 342.82 TaxID=1314786 RepID=A0A6J3MH99_9PEZI|nr:uncharacterized protein K489DRAFT_406028 [Dissoconium aciculare CBS 342.82]KAF1827315.1 hypothetical protein K489DRAFT_406028 [Dissoconium aciculare CBS 342.82]
MFTPGSSRKRQQRRENEDLSIDSSDETCASDNPQMDTDEESHEAHPSVEESFRIDEDDYDTSYAGEGSLVTDPDEHSSDQDSNGDPTEEGYDEAIEVMPRHVVYDKDFPQISQDLSKLATSVCGIIERSGCDNDRSKGCLEKAQWLTKTPDAEKEIVALIGDSGVGKSSLINSLIGIPKLARALSGGTSCTWVCTEYAAAPNEQEPPFSAFIHYKRKEEILDFLRKLLYDYKVYNLESTDEYDAAAKSELRQLSDTAVDIFRSLFCERQEFRSLQTGVECLNQLLEGSGIDDAAQDRGAWCMEILEARLAPHAEMIEVLHADDVKALHRHLDTLAKPIGQYKSTTYWPLIQRIRITIKDVEILQGVSFYDLPGTHDKNAVRLNAT